MIPELRKERIEFLKTKIKEHDNMLFELKKELQPLLAEEANYNSPIKVGDIIQWGRQQRHGRVLEVRCPWGEEFDYAVDRVKKDGSTGSRCIVYHWDKPVKI